MKGMHHSRRPIDHLQKAERQMTAFRLAAFAFALASAGSVSALPVSINESDFNADIGALQSRIETFDALSVGPLVSPVTLTNGIFEGDPSILNQFWCFASPCLTVGVVGGMFHGFPAGTTHWSGRIIVAGGNPTNVLELTVIGNSGTQVFTLPGMGYVQGGVFVGFRDPSGLRSIDFRLVSDARSNFSFDNVITAGRGEGPPLRVDTLSGPGLAVLGLLMLTLGWVASRRFD
jgi:hypothetical protein